VLKPIVGSWGRLLARVNDRDAAEAILEHKDVLGSYLHSIYYIQEYIAKPGRDIRAFVVGDETIAPSTGLGRTGSPTRRAAARRATARSRPSWTRSAGGRAGGRRRRAGDRRARGPRPRLLVNEVNHTMEFRNSIQTTGVDIPGRVAEYVCRWDVKASRELTGGEVMTAAGGATAG
jgi:[lysine-biosynthesis-protein LysW]---L-2-aminoadipate ligase